MSRTTLKSLIGEAVATLRLAAVEQPQTDARMLLQHVLGMSHAELIANLDETVRPGIAAEYRSTMKKRQAGKPVSRIIGEREFFGLRFEIGPQVLDPRPETELLVERALDDFHARRAARFCDLCTGSGAIGIAVLKSLPDSRCTAVDISRDALALAARNGERHGVSARLRCLQADYLAGVAEIFDFIVANPPYVATNDLTSLGDEVRMHDPALALDGGKDGLSAYRKIFDQGGKRLKAGGRLYLEIGAGQQDRCRGIAGTHGWRLQNSSRDLGGIIRVLVFEYIANPAVDGRETGGSKKSLEFGGEQASFHGVQGLQTESHP